MQVEINKMSQVIQKDEKMLKSVALKVKHGGQRQISRLSFEEAW